MPHPNLDDSDIFISELGHDVDTIIPYSATSTINLEAKVYVKHYHRRDGTPVRNHYRRDPR